MKVVVASRNPAKVRAVREAFATQFPDETPELLSADVTSGVGDQPMTDDETRRGARNRANHASKAVPDANFWIGLEGGVAAFDEQLMAFAWMAVKGSNGNISEARSVTLPSGSRETTSGAVGGAGPSMLATSASISSSPESARPGPRTARQTTEAHNWLSCITSE